jgi:hypothetical protein
MAYETYLTEKAAMRELVNGNGAHLYGKKFFVDTINGSDSNSGKDWFNAKKTIMAAVNLARKDSAGDLITTKDVCNYIFIAPGHYNEESLWYAGYNLHLIGMGCPVPGKDYGVSINYTGAITTNAALLIQGSGNSLQNLHVYCSEDIPGILIDNGDNNLVKNCVIECDGTNCQYGIKANSLKGSRIENCVIINPITAGIYADGGADRYVINGHIRENLIKTGTSAGAKGILIDNDMTSYNFNIEKNKIDAVGGGATGIGIDNNSSGNIFIVDNYVAVAATATPIESAGIGVLDNKVTVNGTPDSSFNDGE